MSARHYCSYVFIAIIAILLTLCMSSLVNAQAVYSVTDLGTLGGTYSYAYGINNLGQVVGVSSGYDANGNFSNFGFLYNGGSLQNLGAASGDTSSTASSINDLGQVVGYSQGSNIGGHALLWSDGQMQVLPTISNSVGALAWGMNNKSQIAGAASVGGPYSYWGNAVIWNNQVPTNITSQIGSDGNSRCVSINDKGQAIIQYTYAGSASYLWQAGKSVIRISTADVGYLSTYASQINTSGQVVGSMENGLDAYHAFSWKNGVAIDLGTLGGSSSGACGVNDYGQIVGGSALPGDTQGHAFLYTNGHMTDLNTLIPSNSGWVLENAQAINNVGQIVGSGINPSGQEHAFLLTPVTNTLPNTVLTMTTRDPGSSTDRKVDGIVCDNPPGVTANQNFITVTSDKFSKMTILATLSNPDSLGTDPDGYNNVGQAVVSKGAITYYPPDEFNYWQRPTDTSHSTQAATRTVYLHVTLKAADGSLTVIDPLSIVLARPPVVLVHGINSDPSDWKPLEQAIQSAMMIPFVAVNHTDPKHLDYLGFTTTNTPPKDWLFKGNEPVEVGANLLYQRIEQTLDQIRTCQALTDADQNSIYSDGNGNYRDEINLSHPYTTSDGSYTYRLAARRVDVVAWSYGGVITRWYLGSNGNPPNQWYRHGYPLTLPSGTQVDFATNLPSTSYGQDVRKVITVASMWRGVPLTNYLNETLFPPVNGIDLGLAPALAGFADLAEIVAALPIPTQVPSMEVMAINGKWLSQLIFQNPMAGVSTTAQPFLADVLYGSVAGDDNAYLSIPHLGDLVDPYMAIDDAQQPSWFPYLALERFRGKLSGYYTGPPNYSDGLVPVWSATIPGTVPATSAIVPAHHHSIVTDPGTIAYLEQWLNNAGLPNGKTLITKWNSPLQLPLGSKYSGSKEWQFHAGEMAPHTENNIYRAIDGVGRINPLALQEIDTASAESTTTTQAVVSWLTATEGKTDKIIVRAAGSPLATTYKFSGKSSIHRHLLTGLKPNTQYYWYVITSLDDNIDGSINLQGPDNSNTYFWTAGDPNTNPTPQLSFQVTSSTGANRFNLLVSDTGGDALQFTIVGITFSQPGYAFSYAVVPMADVHAGSTDSFKVGYEGAPSNGSLSCQVNYSCYSVNGSVVTGTSPWIQIK